MKTREPARKKVAILFPLGVPHLDRLTQGIMDYAREHGGWTFVLATELRTPTLPALEHWDGHGAFAMVDPNNVELARRLKTPVVNLSSFLPAAPVPRVRVDDFEVGRKAARHLLECGFRRFAYYGMGDAWYARERGRGFIETVEAAGWTCSAHMPDTSPSGRQADNPEWKALAAWLRTLQSPFGLMACYDQWAVTAMETCQAIGLRVPADVAVIGVNNDTITCEYCQPPLSSVARPDREIGYRAAQLLDLMMSGRLRKSVDEALPPGEVVKRESTNISAVESDLVMKAIRFIRSDAHKGIGVPDVLRHVAVSRRLLEYRFREHLGRTPHQYLCEIRVENAKRLMKENGAMRLKEVSSACGFPELQRFRLVFKRLTGITPRQYRSQPQKSSADHP